jgi:hypothetical protein
MEVTMSVEVFATLIAGLFAGGAMFITIVEHPARMSAGTEFAVREFRPSFRRAHLIMATLALLAFIFGVVAWLVGAGVVWLIGGLVMLANGPWTMVLIRPINKQLLDPDLDISSSRAASLIASWGRLHSVRSVFGCIGFLLFLFGLAQS